MGEKGRARQWSEEGQGKNTEGSVKKCRTEVGMGRQIKGGVNLAREGQE